MATRRVTSNSRRIPIHDHSDGNSGGKLRGWQAIRQGTISAGGDASADHPDLAAHDDMGLATDAELAAHAADTDLHGGAVVFHDEGSTIGTATAVNVTGAGATASFSGGTVTLSVAGTAALSSIIVQDEGSTIGTATVVNIVGAGATASFSGGTATITVTGGGSFTAYDTLISSMSGLVHRWKFEESSGNFADSVGSLTLTASGTITYSVTGGPISGANGSITYGGAARGLSSGLGNIPVGSAARSFVFVYRGFDNGLTGDQTFYSYGSATTRQWFTQALTNTTTLRTATFADDLDFSGQPVMSETWHMVAAVYDGKRILTQFRDGTTGARRLGATLNTSNALNFSIGQDNAGGRQAGAITVDDLAVFDRALSPYELQLLYAAMAGQLP